MNDVRVLATGASAAEADAARSAGWQYSCRLYRANGQRPLTAIAGSDAGAPELRDVLDAVAAQAAVVEQANGF